MWLLILHGFLASTAVVWFFVIWPTAMSANPADPGLFVPYLIVTLVASVILVLTVPFIAQKLLRSL